jgi:hypothetical protein
MSPGGHLATTAAACAASAVAADSWPLAAGIAAGGFLIDVDHAVDYVLFERQRDLRPGAFLRHYLEGRVRRAVLVLHSYELFAMLAAVAWWTQAPLLSGYLVGALMHLALDIVFNGRLTPYSIAAFYSFGYRLTRRFDAQALLGLGEPRPLRVGVWIAFFGGGAPRPTPLPPAAPAPTSRVDARVPDALA